MKNKDELEFVIFCIENIAKTLNADPVWVYDALTKESDILYHYIVPEYDILHTQSREYIVEDILDVMKEEGIVA